MGKSKYVLTDVRSKTTQHNEPSPEYEPETNWKQVMGCLSITSISLAGGVSLSFTSSLFPALQAPDSDIPATPEQCAWLASSGWLSSPVGAIIGGYLMERIGRLTTVQIAVIPFCIAWIIMATAQSFTAILISRLMFGIVFTLGVSPPGVLITETALKAHRGALSSIGLSIHAFGTLCGYTLGAFLDWRTFAWVAILSPVIPLILTCIFTVESPLWLRSRGRTKAAQKASLYYYGDPEYVVQPVIKQSPLIEKDGDVERTEEEPIRLSFFRQFWMLLTLPSGLKPLIILNVMFLLQQCSGIFIILVYAVNFFQDAGSTIDPYYATIMIGVVRFVASFFTIFLVRRFRRRPLMIVSSVGMAICMVASAYSTNLALKGSSPFPSWFPVACVVTYHLSATIGMQTVPWTMASELFPRRVRGAAQSANMLLSEFFGFITLQAYPWLTDILGGAVGLQYCFGAVSLIAAVFTCIFCPETHGKTLTEIEEYFTKNTIYLRRKK